MSSCQKWKCERLFDTEGASCPAQTVHQDKPGPKELDKTIRVGLHSKKGGEEVGQTCDESFRKEEFKELMLFVVFLTIAIQTGVR